MKVFVQGQQEVDLTQKDFVASGGEGSIYTKGATAYKVYTDPTKMIPLGKITELSVLTDPRIIKPEVVLLDPKSRKPLGYTMRYVPKSLPMCQIFTRAFREREGLDHPKMLLLVQKLQALVEHTHKAGVLIVDLNEMNYLVSAVFDEVFAIDVDSYQTPNYRATALMPSVKDWTVHNGNFTEGSDWFSFACVAYQMFTGIHPYKGKHPTIHGLDARMQANASVFDSSVSVPKVVYPMDVIPPGYRAWFEAVLQNGKRVPPPADPISFIAAVVASRIVTSGANLEVTEVASFKDIVLSFLEHNGNQTTWLRDNVWHNGRPFLGPVHIQAMGVSPKMGRVVATWLEGTQIKLYDLNAGASIGCALQANAVMEYDGRIYYKNNDQILELVLNDIANQVIPTPRVCSNVLPNAARLFTGLVYQDLLGSAFVSVFPKAGLSYQIAIPELNDYAVVDARFDNRVLMVVATPKNVKGGYTRMTFVFSEDYATCKQVAVVNDILLSGLNFIVLDNGTCVHITEEEKIEVWNVGAPQKLRIVEDKSIGSDMRLVKYAGRVGFVRGNKVFTMRLK